MCGICGIFGQSDKRVVQNMLEAIKHRGPDNEGFYEDDRISLGVCRLSIVDIEKGNQPIFNEKHTMCIIFNGEIYNYLDLRKKLIERGHKFTTKADTEVILHLFEEYGRDCVGYLKGMFAFAIWDGENLLLARDRMGIKPLFYTFLPHKKLFLFGSEIKTIFQHPEVDRAINEQTLCEQSVLGFILSPDESLFKGVKQLLPGTTMLVSKDSGDEIHIETRRYFSLKDIYQKTEPADIQSVTNSLQSEFENTSKLFSAHSELEKSLFLSGGLDSSLLATFFSKALPIKTFSVADTTSSPDLRFARKVANFIGSEHYEVRITFDDILKEIPNFTVAYENLSFGGGFNRGGDLAFFLLSKEIAKRVKIAITGEGADELFAGYWMHKWPLGYSDRIKERLNKFDLSQNPYARDLMERLEEWFPPEENKDLYFLNTLKFFLGSGLSNYHLWAVDRSSMWHSLEVRVPYLYDDLVQLALEIPGDLKVKDGETKFILRRFAEKYFKNGDMREIIQRKKKAMPDAIENISQDMLSFCNSQIPDKYLSQHPYKQYFHDKVDVLMFDLLYKVFIENRGKVPEGFRVGDLYKVLEVT